MADPDGSLTELGARLSADSPKILCSVLFLVQADDEAIAFGVEGAGSAEWGIVKLRGGGVKDVK